MPVGAVIGGGLLATGGSIAAGKIGADAAKDAARTQTRAGQSALDLQRQIYQNAQPMFAPYQQLGQQAIGNLSNFQSQITSPDPAYLNRRPTPQPLMVGSGQTPMAAGQRPQSPQMAAISSRLVTMRGPDGETRDVPIAQVPVWEARGAVRVS